MKHQHKIRLARKLLSKEEIRNHIPKFLSVNWLMRKAAIKDRSIPMEKII